MVNCTDLKTGVTRQIKKKVVRDSRGYTFSNPLIRCSASGKSLDSLRNMIPLWNGWP